VTVDSEANLYQMTGVDLSNATYATIGGDSIASLTGANSATKALADVKVAINQLAADRASLGAHIETLTMYGDQLGTLKNNLSSANSRIMDVDVAQESTRYAKYNILVQTGTAMLAQANALPQSVLKLLQ